MCQTVYADNTKKQIYKTDLHFSVILILCQLRKCVLRIYAYRSASMDIVLNMLIMFLYLNAFLWISGYGNFHPKTHNFMTSSNMTLNINAVLALKFYQELSIVPLGGKEGTDFLICKMYSIATDFLIYQRYYVEAPKKKKKKKTQRSIPFPLHSFNKRKQNK